MELEKYIERLILSKLSRKCTIEPFTCTLNDGKGFDEIIDPRNGILYFGRWNFSIFENINGYDLLTLTNINDLPMVVGNIIYPTYPNHVTDYILFKALDISVVVGNADYSFFGYKITLK